MSLWWGGIYRSPTISSEKLPCPKALRPPEKIRSAHRLDTEHAHHAATADSTFRLSQALLQVQSGFPKQCVRFSVRVPECRVWESGGELVKKDPVLSRVDPHRGPCEIQRFGGKAPERFPDLRVPTGFLHHFPDGNLPSSNKIQLSNRPVIFSPTGHSSVWDAVIR